MKTRLENGSRTNKVLNIFMNTETIEIYEKIKSQIIVTFHLNVHPP